MQHLDGNSDFGVFREPPYYGGPTWDLVSFRLHGVRTPVFGKFPWYYYVTSYSYLLLSPPYLVVLTLHTPYIPP